MSASTYRDSVKRLHLLSFLSIEPETEFALQDNSQMSEDTIHLTRPIFTFAREEWFRTKPYLTGDEVLYQRLVSHLKYKEAVGRFTLKPHPDQDAFIPFTGVVNERNELAYTTSEDQFENSFEISILELMKNELYAPSTDHC